jgi:hypothetical protein
MYTFFGRPRGYPMKRRHHGRRISATVVLVLGAVVLLASAVIALLGANDREFRHLVLNWADHSR